MAKNSEKNKSTNSSGYKESKYANESKNCGKNSTSDCKDSFTQGKNKNAANGAVENKNAKTANKSSDCCR